MGTDDTPTDDYLNKVMASIPLLTVDEYVDVFHKRLLRSAEECDWWAEGIKQEVQATGKDMTEQMLDYQHRAVEYRARAETRPEDHLMAGLWAGQYAERWRQAENPEEAARWQALQTIWNRRRRSTPPASDRPARISDAPPRSGLEWQAA